MKKTNLSKNLNTSILKIILIIFIITLSSYLFFLNNFEKIEKENNKKNISSILTIINDHLKNLENTAFDYSQWDDTYSFIAGKHDEYINENFREGTESIEGLDLDFMVFTNLKNKKVFSIFRKEIKSKYSQDIENDILKKFNSRNQFASLYKRESFILKEKKGFYLISKAPISLSDNSIAANGFLYVGKKITNARLNQMTKIFTDISIVSSTLDDGYFIDTDYLKNIKVRTNIDKNKDILINIIELHDYKGKYVASIKTTSSRYLIKKGKEAIAIYNFIFALFLFIIFFQSYKSKQFLQNYNKKLKQEVDKKTSELKTINQTLRKISFTDELTQINNRRAFFEKGEKYLTKSVIEKIPFHILMIDIDNFKKINDTFGHDIGDKVLVHLCETINIILNEKHIFARLGGEEFTIIFFDISYEDAYILTEEIRTTIEKAKLNIKDKELRYTVSMGLTQRNGLLKIDQILKESDKLLYNAKNRGKNCIIRDR